MVTGECFDKYDSEIALFKVRFGKIVVLKCYEQENLFIDRSLFIVS